MGATQSSGGPIQQAPQHRPDLRAVGSEPDAGYRALFRNRNFRRLFAAQSVSSLGDWIGVIAIALIADDLAQDVGVGAVMMARVIPGFIAGPVAGVIADRYDRKRVMVLADAARAVIIFSLPFFESFVYLLFASMLLESLTLLWGPAKDASLPNVVPVSHITHANSLNLIAVYGPWPVAGIVFASLASLGGFLGDTVPVLSGLEGDPAALALWLDSVTFGLSALLIWSLALPKREARAGRLDLGAAKDDLVEGVRFVARDKQVRPWLLGIAFTFTAAGGVFSLGPGFVETVLGGGARGFGFLISFLGAGMIVGLIAIGVIARRVQKDVLFSSSILLLGVGLFAFASVGSLNAAIPLASTLGFFGGAAYSMGYSLIHETTEDQLRGRTFSAAYTVIRIGTLVGLGLFPLVASALGRLDLTLGAIEVPGSRATLWLAGIVAGGGGVLSMRAIRHRGDLRRTHRGYLVAFEGGDGSGKTTQVDALARWLEARGEDVVITKEPGGTAVGERVRALLLDPDVERLDARAEALLYAADRAQHVADVVRPALESGKVVLTDRFVDSSLAYQGVARELGVEHVLRVNEWATGGLMPDLVVLLKVDARTALGRAGDDADRMEREGGEFHDRVGDAYLELARRWPDRFVVVDAGRPESEVHDDVVRAFRDHAPDDLPPTPSTRGLGPPGPPGPR
ncbi:MAG TPA: dTMP kinase [Actinomycetota bacterium]|nr:dTMP kinase [Actinomycetota bacterium]